MYTNTSVHNSKHYLTMIHCWTSPQHTSGHCRSEQLYIT